MCVMCVMCVMRHMCVMTDELPLTLYDVYRNPRVVRPDDEELEVDVEELHNEFRCPSESATSCKTTATAVGDMRVCGIAEAQSVFVWLHVCCLLRSVCATVCLGILKRTVTVMDVSRSATHASVVGDDYPGHADDAMICLPAQCMHRFCSECIQKSLRLTRTQCPSCRIHVPSRRNLRNDEAFDSLIAMFYPNLQGYEEQQNQLAEEYAKTRPPVKTTYTTEPQPVSSPRSIRSA